MSGNVSFVSAGPGDPELLTLKAHARLREADVVLYDDLAAGAILDSARPGATLVAVGKRAGQRSARQEHVSRLLVDYAMTGVRFAALADPDQTTAVYMGKRNFPALVAKLIEHGMSPDTPALHACSLGHADEKLRRTTIAQLAEQLAKDIGPATAVILFGALSGW